MPVAFGILALLPVELIHHGGERFRPAMVDRA